MDKKKEIYIILGVFIMILSISFVSAGFFDFFKRDSQLAPSQSTDVSVTVGNAAPTIVSVSAIPAVTLLAGTTKDVTFQFTAEDTNGAADLDDTTASASFSFGGEPTRSSVPVTGCVAGAPSGNQITYTCTITMQYFDDNGAWTVTVSVDDLSAVTATDSSTTVTINLLRDITISPAIITFPATTQSATNLLSSSDTTITNLGNFDTPSDGSIDVTATDLTGTVTPAEVIPAANIRAADITDVGTVCSTGGSALVDTIATGISGAVLPRGIGGSNTGDLTYCINLVPGGISSQGYTADLAGGNQWTIGI